MVSVANVRWPDAPPWRGDGREVAAWPDMPPLAAWAGLYAFSDGAVLPVHEPGHATPRLTTQPGPAYNLSRLAAGRIDAAARRRVALLLPRRAAMCPACLTVLEPCRRPRGSPFVLCLACQAREANRPGAVTGILRRRGLRLCVVCGGVTEVRGRRLYCRWCSTARRLTAARAGMACLRARRDRPAAVFPAVVPAGVPGTSRPVLALRSG